MLTATKRNPAVRVLMAILAVILIVAGVYLWM